MHLVYRQQHNELTALLLRTTVRYMDVSWDIFEAYEKFLPLLSGKGPASRGPSGRSYRNLTIFWSCLMAEKYMKFALTTSLGEMLKNILAIYYWSVKTTEAKPNIFKRLRLQVNSACSVWIVMKGHRSANLPHRVHSWLTDTSFHINWLEKSDRSLQILIAIKNCLIELVMISSK